MPVTPELGGRGWVDPGDSLASQPSRNEMLQIQQEATFQGKKAKSGRTVQPVLFFGLCIQVYKCVQPYTCTFISPPFSLSASYRTRYWVEIRRLEKGDEFWRKGMNSGVFRKKGVGDL